VNCFTTETIVPINSSELSLLRSSVEDAHKRGFATLALKPHSKEPDPRYSPHGVRSATNKLSDALRPYDEGVAANYGIKCADIALVDADRGLKSLEDLNSWMREFNLPPTLTVRTGREGGFHLYYAGAVPSTTFNLGGVTGEIIGIGKYVVGPGSNHPSGQKYKIVNDVALAAFPAEVFTGKAATKTKPVAAPKKVPKGERNTWLTKVAGALRNSGVTTKDAMYAALTELAKSQCEDGENFAVENEKDIRSLADRAVTDFDGVDIGISLSVIRGDQITREKLKYISEPYLPAKLIVLAGNSGVAKSPITRDMTACVTRGLTWPDRKPNPIGPRSVLMLNAEDDPSDTIMPGLDAMGADDRRFYYIKGTKVQNSADAYERQFAFDADLNALIQKAREIPDLALIIVDPVQNYIGDLDHNSDAEMRRIVVPLSNLANELGICIVIVQHLNSREKVATPMHKIMGAKALHSVSRFVYIAGRDNDASFRDRYSHTLTQARGATGSTPSMRYHTEWVDRVIDGKTIGAVSVVWDGQTDTTAEDIINPVSANDKAKIEGYAEVISDLLQDGPKLANECTKRLKEAGWEGNDVTSTTAIKKKAKAESVRIDGKAFWQLIPAVVAGAVVVGEQSR